MSHFPLSQCVSHFICNFDDFTRSHFDDNITTDDSSAHNAKTGEETFFKIKKSTRMQKVFDTYAQRKGIQATSLRFLLDGEKIGADQTPKMLELDDQDQIDCMLEQVRFVLEELLVSFVATFKKQSYY
jgi:small ubiquitin-related modifier